MNSKEYATTVANNFGGIMKDELRVKLDILIGLVRKEIWKAAELKVRTLPTFPPPNHVLITEHEAIPRDDYNRALAFIRQHDDSEWHPITDVQVDIFKYFFAITEMHPEIEFDEEREYQFFRVNDFKQRQSCL
jgi:hypothetical protein